MVLKFPTELIINGDEWKIQPFRFDVHAINTGSYTPSYRDVTVTGVSPLNLPNAEADGLRSIKAYGKAETLNLIDKTTLTENCYLAAGGSIVSNKPNLDISDYIEVDPSFSYKYTASSYGSTPRLCFYDASKTYISDIAMSAAQYFTPVVGTKYVRLSIYKTSLDIASLVQVATPDKFVPIMCNNGAVGHCDYTKVGNPTITDDLIISGTSGTNYVYFANTILGSNFTLITKFTTGDNVTSENFILGSIGRYFVVKYQNAKISFGIGDGSSWKTGNTDSTTSLAIDTTYYYKLTFDGSTYNAYLSTDGETWNLEKTVSLTTIVPMFALRIGCHGNSGSNAAIDLKELQIIINNVPIYKRELVELNGSTAFAQDLLSCGDDYVDEQNITTGEITRKVGYKVFDGTENWATYSGSSSTGYMYRLENAQADPSTFIPLCTHFQGVRSNYAIANMVIGEMKCLSNQFYFCTSQDTLADFKSWLATQYATGTPVIVVYPLETSTTETVAAQDTLQNIEGLNTLYITQSAIDGLSMEVTYSAGVEVTIEVVQSANVDQTVEVTIGE